MSLLRTAVEHNAKLKRERRSACPVPLTAAGLKDLWGVIGKMMEPLRNYDANAISAEKLKQV